LEDPISFSFSIERSRKKEHFNDLRKCICGLLNSPPKLHISISLKSELIGKSLDSFLRDLYQIVFKGIVSCPNLELKKYEINETVKESIIFYRQIPDDATGLLLDFLSLPLASWA